MSHIFLSYSRRDSDIMRQIRDDLRKEGLVVWTDENLMPGTRSWKQEIGRALENAACLVVILSPSSKESLWVQEEMNYAEAQDVRIFPILSDGDEKTAVPFGFITAQRVDIRNPMDYASEIQKLIFTIRVHLGLNTLREQPKMPDPAPEPKPAVPSTFFPPEIAKAIMILQNRESKWWRRVDAITELGSLHDSKVLPVLRAYLDDEDLDVRRAAARQISSLTGMTMDDSSVIMHSTPPPQTEAPEAAPASAAEVSVLAHPAKYTVSTLKLVITGLRDSLRTQFVRSISDIAPVTIDRHIETDDDPQGTTKVSMSFGRMSVMDDLQIYLFAMPSEKQFDFMWKMLGEGMLGFIFIVDATEPTSFNEARELFETFNTHVQTPYVIAMHHHDQPGAISPDIVRILLRLEPHDKILPCSVADSASVRSTLLELTYLILDEMEA